MARQSFTSGQTLTANQMTQLQASVWSDDVNTQTGTSYTLVLTDAGKQVTMSNASASTLTVPRTRRSLSPQASLSRSFSWGLAQSPSRQAQVSPSRLMRPALP